MFEIVPWYWLCAASSDDFGYGLSKEGSKKTIKLIQSACVGKLINDFR